MNETLANAGRKVLKELLAQCNETQQMMFKRMYAHKNLELPIDDAIDNMEEDKIDFAITQAERTVERNNKLV